ncbi:MAG TPA: glycine cleavage system protein GcvH [Candidatus Cybelea sp.]|nr:glycine cleavage system protein GcvH [Candidatus Cybelea sp.]
MALPQHLLYSKEHEWAHVDGAQATIGITGYAQESLGDIVYVELPKVGAKVEQFRNVGVVESVKAVSDLFTPLSGEVTEVNDALNDDPAAVNREPYEGGWLFKLKLGNPEETKKLLGASAYENLTAE